MKVRKATEKEKELSKHWNEWSKAPCEFHWFYDERETFLILTGKAHISDEQGNSIFVNTGDWVECEQGDRCTWKIIEKIRKYYKFGTI